MGLCAIFFSDDGSSREICDISGYYDLHEMICRYAVDPVYEGYDDVYVDTDALDAVLGDIEFEMEKLELLVDSETTPWNLADTIPVNRDNYTACLPFYLKVIKALMFPLRPGDGYIYSFSC